MIDPYNNRKRGKRGGRTPQRST